MAPLTFLHPGYLWLLLPALAIMLLLRRRHPAEWSRPFVPILRVLLAVLMIVALAQPVHGQVQARPQLIVLVDQSAGLRNDGRTTLLQRAQELLAREPGARLIPFAGRPAVVDGRGEIPDAAALEAGATDIAAALGLAGRVQDAFAAPASAGDRVVLLSDGNATRGDATAMAGILRARGVSVDVWPYTATEAIDAGVLALDVPRALRLGDPYGVTAHVFSSVPASATLNLWQDGAALGRQIVTLQAGDNVFSVPASATQPGKHAYQASVQVAGDVEPANDALSATTWVYPPPRVLLVAPLADGGMLAPALTKAGMDLAVIAPADVPGRLSELSSYDGVVLADVPASALSLEQSMAIEQYARVLGRGLLVVGGRQSYTLGGYAGTPLAAALPLSMEPPKHPERPPVALLLIIDHSASMGQDQPDSKLSLAKEAAMRAVETLRADDYVGILAFDDQYDWTVPFQQVGQGAATAALMDRIAGITQGGSTKLYQALGVGMPELIRQPVKTRHALIITDGLTQDGDGLSFRNLASDARSAGATLSAIAVGADADARLTAQIAEWGGGRYHFAQNPQDLPELTLQETRVTQAETVQQGEFFPVAPAPHPLLRGLNPADFPALSGYVALTPRPGAETALVAGPGDPLLAVWQYGLGRVVAWTSDDGREWAARWQAWPQTARFWAQLTRYALPDPESGGPLSVRAADEGGGRVRVTVDALDDSGRPLDLADVHAVLSAADGREWNLPLTQVAPGRYEQVVAVPGQGAYFVEASLRYAALNAGARTSVVAAYAREYRPPSGGLPALAAIAAAGGGRLITGPQDVALPPADLATEPVPLWPWVLGAAALLFPVYVALRRMTGDGVRG